MAKKNNSENIIKRLKSKVLEKAATKMLKKVEKIDKLRELGIKMTRANWDKPNKTK